jgi:uncharacterized protein (DUF433 family)
MVSEFSPADFAGQESARLGNLCVGWLISRRRSGTFRQETLVTTDSLADRITIDPDVCNGRPVVRGMRITVESILDYLSAGESVDEIVRQYPMLERADISACLAFASRLMGHRYSVQETA